MPEPLTGDWSPLSGYRAGQELAGRAGSGGLTAVFVANDQMALGILRAFREAGVRVPEDVAMVGFDDIPEAEFFAPPLTTVRQDFGAVGKRSIQLLLERIEETITGRIGADGAGPDGAGPDRSVASRPPGGFDGLHVVIEPQLIVRSSSSTATS